MKKGTKHSTETLLKISQAKTGQKYPPRSEEYIEKLRRANSVPRPWAVGMKRSESTRRKISESQKGNKHFLGKHHSLLSRILLSEHKKGPKNPNWRGGITKETDKNRISVEYKIWRESVFERDNYTCQKCGKKGGKLNADHIIPWALNKELRYDISNGRTLCENPCHRDTETFGGRVRINNKKTYEENK